MLDEIEARVRFGAMAPLRALEHWTVGVARADHDAQTSLERLTGLFTAP